MLFNTTTKTQEWVEFLKSTNKAAKKIEPNLLICTELIMFKNSTSKTLWTQAAKAEALLSVSNGLSTPEDAKSIVDSWKFGICLGSFMAKIRNSGILAVFTNPISNAVQQQSEHSIAWHTYAIFYRNRILGIYDPSYVAGTKLFNSCGEISLVKGMVESYKGSGGSRKVLEIWIGGGGNDGIQCQEMTRIWVENEICIQGGVNLGNWDQRQGWVKTQF